MNDHDLARIENNIKAIVLFEQWDDLTKASLHTYLSLHGIPYLVNDQYPDNEFWMACKINGKIQTIRIENTPG
jgi:hypothetical protein